MRKLPVILVVLFALGCNKDDDPEKHTSINGYWVVRTPDDETSVAFRILQNTDGLHVIEKIDVRHNGVNYTKPADGKITVVTAREIESITLVNNSFVAPYFVIRFQQVTVNENFTEMQIGISSFNVDGNFREFSEIRATRD